VAAAGDRVGPYLLLAPIGRGAMGEVWRARDERLDRLVAVKLMTGAFPEAGERRTRALREAKAAAAVPHPNVVTLYDVHADGDELALVMELVEGRALSERLREGGPLAVDDAIATLVGIADALVAAHARGILHRDIKAANVMLTAGGVKVLDFGLAKLRVGPPDAAPARPPARPGGAVALDATMPSEPARPSRTLAAVSASDATLAGTLLGTPSYLAPEQLAGAAPDERTEVFALGIVAYEVARGRSPYAATTLDALFAEIERGAALDLDGVWPPLAAVIRRATAPARDERFPTMVALRDALAGLARRRRRPSRWLAIAGIVAALGLAAIGLTARPRAPAATPAAPSLGPADHLVARALEEYDLFYGDKAAASLRGALRLAPDHPRALAYLILFDAAGARRDELGARASARVAATTGRDRHLLAAAAALATRGPAAARDELPAAAAARDRELGFWRAELAYRARRYDLAEVEFRALLAADDPTFRGRIYDHQSAVLLHADRPEEALAIGRAYAAAFPAEADAIGVLATTLAAAGRLDEALAAARDAVALNEGEDTLAGLGKVHARRGEFGPARDAYRRSLERAPPARRPLRRAALALIEWQRRDEAAAVTAVAPCFPGGEDAAIAERGPCLFVGALLDDARVPAALAELAALDAAGTPLHPAYGFPEALAAILEVKRAHWDGGCVQPRAPGPRAPPPRAAELAARLVGVRDFYAEYHLPFVHDLARCERIALLARAGDPTWRAELTAALTTRPDPTPLAILAAELAPPAERAAARARVEATAAAWPALERTSRLAARLGEARAAVAR
jgi:tetratricopeptide (TPR) repeat protein